MSSAHRDARWFTSHACAGFAEQEQQLRALAGSGWFLELDPVRAMGIDTDIDHVFTVASPLYELRVLATEEISGTTRGSRPQLFVARPPSLGELWSMAVGPPGPTALSDHPGYLVSVEIRPVTR